jgi:Uma2 family endonuclease
MSVQLVTRRFTVDDFYRMAQAGILTEDDRVELIEGQVVEMAPIGSGHASRVARLTHLFGRGVGDRALVWVQNPIRLSEFSEPQPDVTLLRPRGDYYAQAHPGPADVLLVVEVADSSVVYDRQTKLLLYARAGIPEVWLEDLTRNVIEVYRSPSPQGYQETHRVGRGRRIAPQAFPDLDLAVDDLLG